MSICGAYCVSDVGHSTVFLPIWITTRHLSVVRSPPPLVGMWMVRPRPLAIGWWRAALYMLVKLVLVPMLMVGCCFAVGLEGAYARAAVLVGTLPVSAGEKLVGSRLHG